MGDRANIVVKQHGGNEDAGYVFLYSHWGGYEMPATLQAALAKRVRWDDESYLARIIFAQMGGGAPGETGFGITTYLTDHEYDLLVVDTEAKTVAVVAEPAWNGSPLPDFAHPKRTWTFDEYIGLDLRDAPWDMLETAAAIRESGA